MLLIVQKIINYSRNTVCLYLLFIVKLLLDIETPWWILYSTYLSQREWWPSYFYAVTALLYVLLLLVKETSCF
jgi:hypothetical protein